MGHYSSDKFENLKHKKVMKSLKEGQKKSIQEYKKENEERVNELIKRYSLRGGIYHKELANRMGLDRKSLRPYLRNLEKKGKIKKKGKDGPYISLPPELEDNLLMAEVFGQKFRKDILTEHTPLILNEDNVIFPSDQKNKTTYDYDCTTYKRFFNFNADGYTLENGLLEKQLFEFSNRIGAFVTYTLIQFMNSDNRFGNELLTRRTEEELTKQMIKISILEMTKFLGDNFRDLIYRSLNISRATIREKIKGKKSILTFEKDKVDKLNDAFSNIYPRMTMELEEISENRYYFKEVFNDRPSGFEAYKKSLEKHEEKLERQKTCKHIFQALGTRSSRGDIIKCEKCGYSKIKRKPGIKPKVPL